MFVLKKLYSNTTKSHTFPTEEAKIASVHAISNQEFYSRIHDYIGWVVVDATYTDHDFVDENNQEVIAHYVWKETVRSTKFSTLIEFFYYDISRIIGQTIKAIGLPDSEQIVECKKYIPQEESSKVYENEFTKPDPEFIPSFELIWASSEFRAAVDKIEFSEVNQAKKFIVSE
jgi:hypothetical protein